MPIWFEGIAVLFLVWVAARVIKRNASLLQRYFIPSSLVGGVVLLLVGHQALDLVPQAVTSWLALFPSLLINVVFAGMFIGHKRPTVRQVWKTAGPMIAFGNTIAWGMYVIGIGLTMVILGPLFGAPPIFGALLEISFSGGHGTAAGLSPTFAHLGYSETTSIALGLATISIMLAVISGLTIINIYNRRSGRIVDRATMKAEQSRMIRRGYDLTRFGQALETKPHHVISSAMVIGAAIGIGWLLLIGLRWAENALLGTATPIRVFAHLPLFPLAMFGGLIVQAVIERLHLEWLVRLNTIKIFGAMALDLLMITAIGTMSLNAISDNIASFAILAIAGTAWILLAFFVLAPRFFNKHWFEYGMTDVGQAMGMTATGLLLNRLADPMNRTGARESFAYKQLAYEPFMGGGIVTAFAVVAIVEFGQWPVLVVGVAVCAFWLFVGFRLGNKRHRRHLREHSIAQFVMREF